MSQLTSEEISEEFNRQRDACRAKAEKKGIAQALAKLSEITAGLRDAGLDVSLELLELPNSLALKLLSKQIYYCKDPIMGVLKINNAQMPFVLAVQYDYNTQSDKDFPLHLGIAYHRDIRYLDFSTDLQSEVYDVQEDPESWDRFQKDVIGFAAKNDALLSYDTYDVFDGGKKLRKPVLPSLRVKK